MLRFSTSEDHRRHRLIVIGLLLAMPSLLSPRARARPRAVDPVAGCRAGSCRTRRSCSGSTCRAARTCCSRSTSQAVAPRARSNSCATTFAASCASSRSRSVQGGIQRARRAASASASPTRPSATRLLPKLRELSQPIGNGIFGQARRPAHHRDRRAAGRADPAHGHRGRRQRAGAPGHRPGHRGPAPPRRRARHDRAEHPAPGRGPHPRAGAGPAGSAAAEGDPRQTAQLEFRLVAEPGARPATSSCCPRRKTARPAHAGRAPRHRRGRGPHRRPAGLRPAHRRADRQLQLQHPRRPALRPGDHRERRAGRSRSCSTTR